MKKSSWVDPSIYIRNLHVAEDVLQFPYTQEILKQNLLPVTIVSKDSTPAAISGNFPDNLKAGKQHLYLCSNKGDFFKPCPGTAEYQCCDYHVLSVGMNCPIDCVYCILQAYLDKPWITAFVNIDKLFSELDSALQADRNKFFRIGTGEFTDSLAFERITGMSRKLVEFLASYDNVLLELKTKSGYIDTLEKADHRGKTILSWSLNSTEIITSHEIRSATLEERLDAARKGAEWGYGLGFHFDPIIEHPNWRKGYVETIDALFATVPKESIAWISLGALRYLQPLKEIGTNRFPHSRIFFNEFILGLDGKARYFRSQRQEMYTYIYNLLREKISPDTCIYFCMESDEIWHDTMGFIPETQGGIPAMLDKAARRAISKF